MAFNRLADFSLTPGLFADWRRDCAFNGPAIPTDTLRDGFWSEAIFLGPLGKGLSFAVELKNAIAAAVVRLFNVCRPPAVAWLVVRRSINAIKSHAFRAISHVSGKCHEVVAPSVANCNPASPVISELVVLRVVASGKHARIGLIERMRAKAVLCSVLLKNIFRDVHANAAARNGVAAPKISSGRDDLRSAVADTFPRDTVVVDPPRMLRGDGKAAESVTDKIERVMGGSHIYRITHFSSVGKA